MKFYTWLITISTKEDLEPVVSDGILTYLKKKCRYGYVVLEHASATLRLHMHACVCFKNPIEKKHFTDTIWQHVKPRHPSAIKTVAVKATVQYNDQWYREYLQKDLCKSVLWQHIGDDYPKFYPTQEEQEQLIAAKALGKQALGEAKDPWFAKHEVLWEEHSPDDASYESAVLYLRYCMHDARTMPLMKDRRRLRDTAMSLHEYRTRFVGITTADRNYYFQETGIGHSYT